MKKLNIICITLLICTLFIGCANEKTNAQKPTNDIYVVDNANLISESIEQNLLSIGKDLDNKYGAQLIVLTINSLNGEDIETFSNRTFREWGIGNKEKNNGVLIVVSKNDHKDRIEVGYGLEGAITDGKAGSILSSMNREFKNDNFNSGIENAYLELSKLIYQEYGDSQADEISKQQDEKDKQKAIVTIVVIVFVVVLFVVLMDGNTGGRSGGGGGFYSSSSSSSSSSSGSSSFGGGSSGGGGASGSW